MEENQQNIWKDINNTNQKNFEKENFSKRIRLIHQIENEKTSSILSEENLNENNSKKFSNKNIKFTNRKRSRKLKHKKKKNIKLINNIDININDKSSDDDLKSEVKIKFHNYIIELLNSKIKTEPGKEKLKFEKLQSNIEQNNTVEFNQNLFNKKIKDILIDVSNKYQNKNINIECID